MGRPFLEVGLVADQGGADKGAELGRVLAGMEGPPAEMEIVRKDGTRVPVEVAGRMVKRGDGSMQVQAILRNIEERKQAERARAELEAELRHAQRLESVGRLAGGIAHDFNNLLTVILSTASTLRTRPLTPDQQGEVEADVDAIQAAAQRAADLTRQLLAFSRKQILRPQVVDLGEVIVGRGEHPAPAAARTDRAAAAPGAAVRPGEGRSPPDPAGGDEPGHQRP